MACAFWLHCPLCLRGTNPGTPCPLKSGWKLPHPQKLYIFLGLKMCATWIPPEYITAAAMGWSISRAFPSVGHRSPVRGSLIPMKLIVVRKSFSMLPPFWNVACPVTSLGLPWPLLPSMNGCGPVRLCPWNQVCPYWHQSLRLDSRTQAADSGAISLAIFLIVWFSVFGSCILSCVFMVQGFMVPKMILENF